MYIRVGLLATIYICIYNRVGLLATKQRWTWFGLFINNVEYVVLGWKHTKQSRQDETLRDTTNVW
jgi:hypothetical protein